MLLNTLTPKWSVPVCFESLSFGCALMRSSEVTGKYVVPMTSSLRFHPTGMMGPRRRMDNQESPRMLLKDEAFPQ